MSVRDGNFSIGAESGGNLSPVSRSRSAPTTPRGGGDEGVHTSLAELQEMTKEMEQMPKDMQIALLKEKLSFTVKQLDEKERQLDQYKQMVATLQDVLTEVTANRQRNTQVRPPPGFEPKVQKYPIMGRKVRSFHHRSDFTDEEREHDRDIGRDNGSATSGGLMNGRGTDKSWRKAADESPSFPSSTLEPLSFAQKARSGPSNAPVSKSGMTKSVSTNALSDHLQATEGWEAAERESKKDLEKSSSRGTAPPNVTIQRKPEVVGNASPSSVAKKREGTLKKSQSMTSMYSVLEENRLDLKFPELDQLVGQIYALSKYQQGCRFLQKKLDEKNPTNTNIILKELSDHMVELMTDPFGNYLFTKLIENCDPQQREKVVDRILPEIVQTTSDMYGTQSLQKIMPFLNETQIQSVVSLLNQNPIGLIKHNKANYLIQYCLDHLSPTHNQWIYDAVTDSMEEVARDRVGCVIVKRCIDHATPEQKLRLAGQVSANAFVLVQDPFGNYVVQHLLSNLSSSDYSKALISNLLGHITDLCTQKFSSNVVEMCLKVSDAETRRLIVDEIIHSEVLPQLLNDKFANFVVQTVLDVAESDQRQQLVKTILPHLGQHYSPYTKRLQKKILPLSPPPQPQELSLTNAATDASTS